MNVKAESSCAHTSKVNAVGMETEVGWGADHWGWLAASLAPGAAGNPVLKGTRQRVVEQNV